MRTLNSVGRSKGKDGVGVAQPLSTNPMEMTRSIRSNNERLIDSYIVFRVSYLTYAIAGSEIVGR